MNWIFAIIAGAIGSLCLLPKKYYWKGLLISMVPVYRFLAVTILVYVTLIILFYAL